MSDQRLGILIEARETATAQLTNVQRSLQSFRTELAAQADALSRFNLQSSGAFDAVLRKTTELGTTAAKLTAEIRGLSSAISAEAASAVTALNGIEAATARAAASMRVFATSATGRQATAGIEALAQAQATRGISATYLPGEAVSAAQLRSLQSATAAMSAQAAASRQAAAEAQRLNQYFTTNRTAIDDVARAEYARLAVSQRVQQDNANVTRQLRERQQTEQLVAQSIRQGTGESTQAIIARTTGAGTRALSNQEYEYFAGLASGAGRAEGALARIGGRVREVTGNLTGMTREGSHAVAALDELSRGQRGQLFSTLGASLRDAGLGFGTVAASFAAVAGVMAFERMVKGFADLAVETRDSAAAAGMSVSAYSQLQNVMQVASGSANALERTFAILHERMDQALNEPLSKAAEGFAQLHISTQQIAQGLQDPAQMLELLRTRFQELGAAGIPAFEKILGTRDFVQIAAYLRMTDQEYQQVVQSIQRSNATLDADTAEKLANVRVHMNELDVATKGLGEALASFGTSTGIVDFFTRLEQAISGVLDKERALKSESEGDWLQKTAGAYAAIASVGMVNPFGISIANRLLTPDGPSATAAITQGTGFPSILQDQYGGQVGPAPTTSASAFGGGNLAGLPTLPTSALNRSDTGAPALLKELKENLEILTRYKTELQSTYAVEKERASLDKTGGADVAAREAAAMKQLEELNQKLIADYKAQAIARGASAETIATGFAPLESSGIAAARNAEAQQIRANITLHQEEFRVFQQTVEAKIAGSRKLTTQLIADEQSVVDAAKVGYNISAEGYAQLLTKMAELKKRFDEQEIRDAEQAAQRQTGLLTAQRQQLSAQARVGAIGASGEDAARIQRQAAQQDAALAQQAAQIEIEAQQKIIAAHAGEADVVEKAEERIAQIRAKLTEEEVSDYEKAYAAWEKSHQAMTQFFSELGSAFETGFSNVIKAALNPQKEIIHAGLTTIVHTNRMQQIEEAIGKMLDSMLEDVGKTIMKSLWEKASKSLFGEGGPSGFLAGLFGDAAPKAAQFGLGATSSAATSTSVVSLGTAATTAATALQGLATSATGLTGKGAIGSAIGTPTDLTSGLKDADTAAKNFGSTLNSTGTTLSKVIPGIASQALSKEGVGNVGQTWEQIKSLGTAAQTASAAQILSSTSTTANSGATLLNTAATASDTTAMFANAAATETAATAETAKSGPSILSAIPFSSIFSALFSRGGIVPSAAGGMMVGMPSGGIPGGGQISILHPNEMVLPSHISQGVQNMINGQSGAARQGPTSNATLNYSPSINATAKPMGPDEFASMLSANASEAMGIARNLVRGGWRG